MQKQQLLFSIKSITLNLKHWDENLKNFKKISFSPFSVAVSEDEFVDGPFSQAAVNPTLIGCVHDVNFRWRCKCWMGHDESDQFPAAGQFIIRTPFFFIKNEFFTKMSSLEFQSNWIIVCFILCQSKSLVETICSDENKFYLALGSDRLQRGRALQLYSILIGCIYIINWKWIS